MKKFVFIALFIYIFFGSFNCADIACYLSSFKYKSSDILLNFWHYLKYIYFYPGDFMIHQISYVFGLGSLYEMAHDGYEVASSFIAATFIWIIFFTLFFDVLGRVKKYCEENLFTPSR